MEEDGVEEVVDDGGGRGARVDLSIFPPDLTLHQVRRTSSALAFRYRSRKGHLFGINTAIYGLHS